MKEGKKDIENRLLFTLPYLLFILLQNFTQTIANLHTWVEHRGTKQQKIKSISHPKGINNIKDKLFFFKTDTFIWNNILLLQKINKSSKESLIFYESLPSNGIQFLSLSDAPFSLCVSLHLALLSVSCSRSLFPRRSSQLSPSTVSCPCHRNMQCLWLSHRWFSPFLCDISTTVSCPVVLKPHTAGECVCVWAAFRPPVGRAESALLPGCCWRSTQAFRHSPSLVGQDSPSTPQAPPCPRNPAPPQLHRGERAESLWFILHIKKDKHSFCRGPLCNLWWCCIVCQHTTGGLVMI